MNNPEKLATLSVNGIYQYLHEPGNTIKLIHCVPGYAPTLVVLLQQREDKAHISEVIIGDIHIQWPKDLTFRDALLSWAESRAR